jgi:predicted nuclease of predicted toxin-antitoxin system
MRPLDFPLFADENIHPDVIRALAAQGKDIRSVIGEGLVGRADAEILRHAHAGGRVVLTHDSDFGVLVYRSAMPFTGVVYLRPGHISPTFVLQMITALEASTVEVTAPFLVVAERKEDGVRVKYRMGDWS